MPRELMHPPAVARSATLANWREHPHSTWSLQHVRELIPTAHVARAVTACELHFEPRHLLDLPHSQAGTEGTTLYDTLRETNADALLVMRRGKVVFEWYDHGMTPRSQHVVFSVTKSITGSLAGPLVEAGMLDVDAPVTRYVPDVAHSVYGGCTVRHLLDMTVAVEFTEDYGDPHGDVRRYRFSTGWDERPVGLPAQHLHDFLSTLRASGQSHGQAFDYVSPNTDMLGWVFEAAAGASFARLLEHFIWQPMGAEEDAYITVDALGAARAAGGFCCTMRDLARFGEMMRCRGLINGRQVVPGWWVDDLRREGDPRAFAQGKLTEIFPKGRYRSKWYGVDPTRGTFAAVGIHGQWIYVDPEAETVIVKMASQSLAMDVAADRRWLDAFAAISTHLEADRRKLHD